MIVVYKFGDEFHLSGGICNKARFSDCCLIFEVFILTENMYVMPLFYYRAVPSRILI